MTFVVKIEKTGGPEVLKFATVKLDKPGPEEVLIEHKAIGLNFIDTYHRSGLYPVPLPSGIGAEGSGVIKEIGLKVKNFSINDRVAYAGVPLGSYSSERIYPTKNLVKIPNYINFEIAATLMTKGLTAYYLLYKTFPVSANQTILFHAAAGGVGQIFCQWAKSLGCKVIGTVGSDEKIKIAKKNGCDFIINYSKENFSKKVLEITKDKGVSFPEHFSLKQNFPNPFNPSTAIRFSIPEENMVTIEIFDMLGRLIDVIYSQKTQPGDHIVHWDATDTQYNPVSTGVYFYRIQSANYSQTRKMLYLK